MKVFCQYLRKRANRMFFLIFSSVSVFIFFLTLSVQFKFVRNDYHALNALQYALEVLPVNLYVIFPVLFVLGWWILFYRLHAKGELMQMYASGVTPSLIASWLRLPLIVWLVGMVLLGECAGPLLERHAKKHRMQAMMDYQWVEHNASLWLKEKNGFIEATRTESHARLINVKRYTTHDHKLISIELIPEAVYKNRRWQLKPGKKVTFSSQVKWESTDVMDWDTRLTPQLLGLSSSTILQKPLYKIISILGTQSLGLFNKKEFIMFWARLFLPIKIGLLATWLCYRVSRICLWRLAQHTIYYSLGSCMAFGALGLLWRQLSVWLFSGTPYLGDLLACLVLIYCIYQSKHASMVSVYSQD